MGVEASALEGQLAFYSAVVVEPGEALAMPAEKVRQVVTEDPALGDLILRAFILRRSLLIELGVNPTLEASPPKLGPLVSALDAALSR